MLLGRSAQRAQRLVPGLRYPLHIRRAEVVASLSSTVMAVVASTGLAFRARPFETAIFKSLLVSESSPMVLDAVSRTSTLQVTTVEPAASKSPSASLLVPRICATAEFMAWERDSVAYRDHQPS